MEGLELGDIVTLGFEYNGFPADTPFVVSETAGSHSCDINGTAAAVAFRLKPLNAAQLERYREWEQSDQSERCFSLQKEIQS